MNGGVRFAGYAALFDRRDRGGDVIVPGAFAESLRRRLGSGESLPILWQHDPAQPIGTVESIAEDARGLRVIGRLESRPGVAARAAEMLRAGAVDGLSFGYRVVAAQTGEVARRLEAVDIVEVSLVAHPMQPAARVHAVEG
ncbi:HK97 family phage prohead protease [Sphingobium sufflavum]|uniref:HK97 family phage prohead protease n=1 Tax=Sphingobium sufflavum TaxID=1129547 RepID=UPI001F427081|nr:HK97 family phage prohead protease [Sphingobium sufflavum]MCE7798655.1 HK97 family phage prohead protease [Sphingobium sufflavum]